MDLVICNSECVYNVLNHNFALTGCEKRKMCKHMLALLCFPYADPDTWQETTYSSACGYHSPPQSSNPAHDG